MLRGFAICRLAAILAFPLVCAGQSASADDHGIKVGVLADMSGYASSTGGQGAVTAAQMAVDDTGKAVAGKPISVVSADMQSKPDIAASIARKWFDEDGVDIVVDVPVSSVALAVQGVARDKHKSMLTTAGLTTELTRGQCSPWTMQWADDTSALSQGTVRALAKKGLRKWFFVTADFAFGQALQRDATAVLQSAGGEVVGSVKAPMQTSDFSSFLLEAQSSTAQVVAFANASVDTINSIKQAGEFGLAKSGKQLAALLVYISDVHSIGLDNAQGLFVTSGFYWDESDAARAFAKRFFAIQHAMPTKEQANIYAGLMNYFHAVQTVGSADPDKVTAWLKSNTLDYFGRPVTLRADGRVMYDLTLYQVKSPAESHEPWDYYKKVAAVPAAQAFLPLDASLCRSAAGK
jgi:branched-chain amino acid transport system substrate-binding protein